MNNNGNIVLAQIIEDTGLTRFTKELIPESNNTEKLQALTKDKNNRVSWSVIEIPQTIIPQIELYNDNGRIGIGRMPLYNYKFDIAVENNVRTTALHIGDGKYGFSLGNGTDNGFLPEIIGVGKDENDAGLYFVGIAGNDKESTTPLIIFDGRDMYSSELTNRPILGVISGDYNKYDFLIDAQKNVHVKDIIIDSESLVATIEELRKEITLIKSAFNLTWSSDDTTAK